MAMTVTVHISKEHRKMLKELSVKSGSSIQKCLSDILDKYFKISDNNPNEKKLIKEASLEIIQILKKLNNKIK